jgi:hypothetical protein
VDLSSIVTVFGTTEQLGDNVIGYCELYSAGMNLVVINRTWWNSHNDNDKRSLFYHEMGHCSLKRDHVIAYDPNRNMINTSIMFPYATLGNQFLDNYAYYLDELYANGLGTLKRPKGELNELHALHESGDCSRE